MVAFVRDMLSTDDLSGFCFMEIVPRLVATQHSILLEKTSTLTDPCNEVQNSTALEITV